MPSKIHALVACSLIIGTAAAQHKTHTAHKGDHRAQAYTVRNGENDWTIAKKLGISVAQLHKLNPDADWSDLQIGTTLSTCSAIAPSSRAIRSKYAEVSADNTIIRRSPSTSGEKITLVDKGTKAVVLSSKGGWTQLRFPKGTVGWVRNDLLGSLSAPTEARREERQEKKVERVATAEQPALLSRTSRWAATRLAAKRAISKAPQQVAMLETYAHEATAPTDAEVLLKAFDMRGTHYVWGGESARGVDCSGFTSIVFRRVGISLPRTSRSQSTIGVHVGFKDLEPGDLLFFHTGGSYHINHVGLYIGNGRFIHASSGFGAVRVDTLSGHYGHELVTARRVPQLRHVDAAETTPVAEKVDPTPPSVPKAVADATSSQAAVKPEEPVAKQEVVASKEPKTTPAPAKKVVASEEREQEWQSAGSLTKKEKLAAEKAKADGDNKKETKKPDVH